MKLLLDDGDAHVGGHGAPDLRLHRVLAGAQELLDSQVPLDPFEDQLHLLSVLVQRSDAQSWPQRVQLDGRLGGQGLTPRQLRKGHDPKQIGAVEGTVALVTSDAVNDEKRGAIFPARLILKTNRIAIDGKPIRLTPGMNVTAEIKTGQRRVIDYLLSPIQRAGIESLRER